MNVLAKTEMRTEPDKLLKRARMIADVARQRADETEQARRIAPDVIDLMRASELFRVFQPKRYGGFEYGYDLFVQIVAAIAAGCPSTGWVCSLGMVHQWFISLFPQEAQDDVWGENPGAIAFGSYSPSGNATAVEGGYRLEGSWSFTSGCDNGQWFLLGGRIPNSAGAPVPVFYLVPAKDCVIEDNWFTMGLSGTGSKIVLAKDIFVPKHRIVHVSDLTAGTTPGGLLSNNPLYRISLLAILPLCLVGATLGMAEGALESFLDVMKTRVTRGAVAGGNNRMAEFATVQLRVAEASASIDAGRLLIFRDIEEAVKCVEAGQPISIDMRIRNRLDHAFCAKLFTQAVDALFLASGGNAIYTDKAIQRYWRDIHAADVHISLNWDAVGTMFGQHKFGLEPKGQY